MGLWSASNSGSDLTTLTEPESGQFNTGFMGVSGGWLHRILAVALVAPAVALLPAPTPVAAAGTTYYVDGVAGSDTATGTSPGTAWKSLTKVDATTFNPGDRILLHTDQTWAGRLAPLGNGTAGSPITISSYGGGARPHIDGGSLSPGLGAVYLVDQNYWTVDGLEVTSNTGTDNFNGGTTRSGIYINNGGWGVVRGITLTNNLVHDVNGCFICSDYDGHGNGGIVVWTDLEASRASYAGVLIANNVVDHVGRSGISFGDMSFGTGQPYYVDQASLSTGVVIRDNHVSYSDSDGIVVVGTDGTLIEHNVVGNAGQGTVENSTEPSTAGIWPGHAMNTTVQYNEVYGTQTHVTDGQGYDNDLSSSYAKFQYNYSHDNQGGFILIMGGGVGNSTSPAEGLVVRNNLSVNDGWGGVKGVFTFSYGVSDSTDIYNNTVYIPAGSTASPMYCDGCVSETVGDFSFHNNIVENLGSGTYLYPAGTDRFFWPGAGGAVFDHNLFHGNHPTSEPADPHKLTSDPLLVSPASPAPYGYCAVAGYKVGAGSPAIGSGVAVPENGGVDYFGATLPPTAPTLGFAEVGGFTGAPTLVDGANGYLASAQHSPTVALDSSLPDNFGGDASRFSRTSVLPGTVTWQFDGMQSFDATVYRHANDPSVLTFWSSSDGVDYSPVAISATSPVPTANSWGRLHVTPSTPLPSGTRFLRARMVTPGFDIDTSDATSAGLPPNPPAQAPGLLPGPPPPTAPSTMEIGNLTITGVNAGGYRCG
jgi:hypothetical protein